MKPLEREYYLQDTLTVAKDLLGKYLIHYNNGVYLAGRITETEAYIGAIDKACHAYGGKITPRTKTLYAKGGTSYVYFIYGMYFCMNVVTEAEGIASAVLIRGLKMASGLEEASLFRYNRPLSELTKQQIKHFSDGPGKLCKAMNITKELNNADLCSDTFFISENLFNERIPEDKPSINISKRIGIDYAEEAIDFPWRFFIEL